MITKKTFIATMKALQRQRLQEAAMSVLLEDMTGETHFFNVSENIENALINILTECFEDKNGRLSWWIYEKDFGQKELKACNANKKGIKLNTAEQLYNFLVKEKKK
jgi:hypothetical protein